jgi:hypothetical protein
MAHRGPGFEAVLTARGVFTAGADGRVVLWDPNDWERRRDWKFEDNDLSMDATRDGTLVVSHGRHISTLGPAQERFETVLEADQPIRQVGVSPDGAEMTWVTEENLMFKGPLDGSRITPIEHLCPGEGETKMAHWTCDGTPDGPATDVAYSSQGRYRVVSFEGLRYRWDRETGETFAGVGDSVIAGAPDPTGKRDAALFPGRLLWMPEHEEDEDPGQHVHSPDQEPTHISNPGKDSLVYATAENELRAWYPRLDQDYWLSTTLDGVVRIVAGETWTAVLDDDGGLTVFELPKDFL